LRVLLGAGIAALMLVSLYLGLTGRIARFDAAFLIAIGGVVAATVARLLSLQARPELDSRREAAVLECSGDLVTWHTSSGSVLTTHAPAGSPIRIAGTDLHGQGLLNRVHVGDRPLFLKTISDAAHGDTVRVAQLRIHGDATDGHPTLYWVEMRARRLGPTPAEAERSVVCVMRDITLRRSAEEDRERVIDQAAAETRAKGGFLATVSHELRTPLNAIIGFSEMLTSTALMPASDVQRAEYAQIIHSSGHHLLEVVNALLDMSKIESGGMTLEPEPTDLVALVNGCCELMSIRAAQAGIAFEQVAGPGLDQVVCDRRAMKQIVINLLSNALKFTPPGGSVLIAAVLDGNMVDISVTDTGIGITAQDLPQLGQPFFQAKATYDRPYEGTGLGLSVVRGLVGLHGGGLEIESAPGAGTRVSLRIPRDGGMAREEPVQISTFVKAPPKGLAHLTPYRLTA
jgi:cell cycle sensor histidine kinase DivJ